MMRSPILYQVNTRAWLRELSEQSGRPVTLADLPETEIQRWQSLGFTHIWLMGVWQVGEGAREEALRHWRETWSSEIESSEADVHGSPFAIREYGVDKRLGETIDLLLLKERFGRSGLSLILDFVPNHLSLDSPEPVRYPARFIQSPSSIPGATFEAKTRFGKRHFAHGRDPYFPPWTDTVQLDYRVAETQESMNAVAQTVSMFGHGLRCDMAMLLLPDIFQSTWRNFPSQGSHQTMASFWRAAIPAIRQLQPHVDLIAEAYWDREQELQDLGFDFTYNKKVTDFIVRGQIAQLADFLAQASPHYLRRSVHFLENHDEARAAASLPWDLHKAAALLILSLPGMTLLHDGQLEGRTRFARIQLSKRHPESANPEITAFYDTILKTLPATAIRRGKPSVQNSAADVISISWENTPGQTDVSIVNLHAEPKPYPIPQHLARPQILFSTSDPAAFKLSPAAAAQSLTLPPRSGAILRFTSGG